MADSAAQHGFFEGLADRDQEDFETLLSILFRKHVGYQFSFKDKAFQFGAILKFAREQGFSSSKALIAALQKNFLSLEQKFLEAFLREESQFFDDPKVFKFFTEAALPDLMNKQRETQQIRVWSAGCAQGQEAYSVALILWETLGQQIAWRFEVLGTDVIASNLDRAKLGLYDDDHFKSDLAHVHQLKSFKKEEGGWRVPSFVRSSIKFQQLNLLDSLSALGTFDCIFCRSLFKHMVPDVRASLATQFAQMLSHHGFLVLGSGESLLGVSNAFEQIDGCPGFYRKKT